MIVDVKGVKLEIDERNARVVENYKIGDKIKVLVKKYSDTFEISHGVILGFEMFKELPTIVILYLEVSYDSATTKIVYYNSQSKDIEITKSDLNLIPLEENRIIELMDKKITGKKAEMDTLVAQKEFYIKNMGKIINK